MKSTTYKLPHNDNKKEIIYLIETTNRTSLSLASNFYYELWINNKFVGSGGHRCTDTEIYVDNWNNLLTTDLITIKYQWFNCDTFNVWYRRIFPIAIFVDMTSSLPWILSVDNSIEFGDKICAQLPHQNIITQSEIISLNVDSEIDLKILDKCPYIIKPLPILPCEYINIMPKLIHQNKIITIHPNFEYISSKLWPNYKNMSFSCDTYDLGYIALHRFEIYAKAQSIIMYYGEVDNFADLFNTQDRRDVKLCDGVGKSCYGSPIGTRGCRYINIIYPTKYACDIELHAQRYQYPFSWIDYENDYEDDCAKLIDACKNNLIACVDGGVVDTCWRERTQWTGDARISLMALKTLTKNIEIIEFVLDQIAQSYDETTGMVQGAYPMKKPNTSCEIPTYHLAFCYAVIEYYGLHAKNKTYDIMLKSIQFWRNKYIENDILIGMPGWYFLDWNKHDTLITDKLYVGKKNAHSVCNAMFYDICTLLNIDSGIDMVAFNELFCWNDYAYTINSNGHPSLHATSMILSLASFSHTNIGKEYLIDIINNDFKTIKSTVTPYFAYFIAKALKIHYPDEMMSFIHKYYDPIVNKYGTIYEKTKPISSMAHGWSIGIASLIKL